MSSRWKLLSALERGFALPLSITSLGGAEDTGTVAVSTTIDASSVTSNDLFVVLNQGEAGGGTTFSCTVNGQTATDGTSNQNTAGNGMTGIFYIEGSVVAGDATTAVAISSSDAGFRGSIQCFRIVNGSGATILDSATQEFNNTSPISVNVDFSEGVLLASGYYSNDQGHTFTAGTETQFNGIQNGNGSGDGAINQTPTTASHTVTYTNAGAVNTQGDSLSVIVFTNGNTGGGGTNPLGLSPSLLSFSGTNDAWSTRTVDISSYADETVYLVFRYQNGNGFQGDIQLDNIQLDGTTYSFENVTHSFETSNNDNPATYAEVSWTSVLIEADNNREGRWCVDSGGTPSNGTGRTDADAGTWYIYAETSGNAATAGYNIWLRSPLTTLSAAPTLQFAEARNGGDIGTLDVHLDVTDGGSAPPPTNDVTPDAVDWNNLSTEGSSATTNTQTISGINTTITLDVSFTQDRDQYTLEAFVNGSSVAGPTNSPGTLTFNVSNGDTVYFTASGGESRDSTATVINTSDGDTTIDTFGVDLQN